MAVLPGFLTRPREAPRSQYLFYQIALRLLIIALLFAVLNVGIIIAIYVQDEDDLGKDLIVNEAERIAEAIDWHTGALPTSFPALPEHAHLREAYALLTSTGAVLNAENKYDLPLDLAPPAATLETQLRRDNLGEGLFRLYGTRRFDHNGVQRWLVITMEGQGFKPFWPAVFKELREHAFVPMIPLALLLIVFNTFVVRRMLSPLEEIVTAVAAIGPTDPSRRLPLPSEPAEVRALVKAFNHAFDRLESLISTLRNFTADAAHELRTPLAIMTLSVNQLPDSALKHKLRADTAAMTRLVRQMLDLAQADALRIPPGARADLCEVAITVVEQLTPMAVHEGRHFEYSADGTPVIDGVPEMLERAVRNIVENALQYAPAGSVVAVHVGPGPTIAVRDRGPGISPEHLAQLCTRFWRGDRRRGDGAGLGLGIATRIVEGHAGHIEFRAQEGGGTEVLLHFGSGSTSITKA